MALLAGFISGAPAAAVDDPIEPEPTGLEHIPPTDRGKVLELWKTGGPGIRAAAEVALTGTDTDVRRFLDQEAAIAQLSDDRVDTVQILTMGGRAVREAARTALAGTPQQLTAFLKDGWQKPLEEDQRVQAAQVVSFGGREVQAKGRAAL